MSASEILPRWYMLNNYGAATLCVDQDDAQRNASAADMIYPRDAPHVAVQLAPAPAPTNPAEIGSKSVGQADEIRCRAAKRHVERAMEAIAAADRLDTITHLRAAMLAMEGHIDVATAIGRHVAAPENKIHVEKPMQWQPMETAPKNKKVLAGYRNSHGHWRNVTAINYADRTLPMEETNSENEDEFAPPGWYETSETHDTIHAIEHEPVRWQPLPPPPNDA